MDERALIKKLNRRSRGALDQAVARYTPYVSAVILRTLAGRASREDVEELSADVFVALWTHAGTLDPEVEKGLRPWLAAVAKNKATDFLRRSRPSAPIPEDAPDPSPGPEELAQRRDQSARLWAAVDGLEEPDRTLFVRYYYEGDKLKTIAAELGLSQTAAKQRLFRGRKALKAALQEGAETRGHPPFPRAAIPVGGRHVQPSRAGRAGHGTWKRHRRRQMGPHHERELQLPPGPVHAGGGDIRRHGLPPGPRRALRGGFGRPDPAGTGPTALKSIE